MDTNKDSAASEVPTFKVARVGQERKRKGGAFSFLRGGGGPRGAWTGATGGAGAGVNALGMTLTKALISVMVAAGLGSASVYLGSLSAKKTKPEASAKPALFAQDKTKIDGDISNLPSNSNSIPNSMGFITGSRDGLTPEERAKKEADAAAAAEAQRKADEEAAKKAEAENTAGNPADPNALLASAQADGKEGGKGAGFGKKFGALSSSMGGGSSLSGGAGMSGGVNRQFGSGGGMGGIAKGAGGQLSAMKGTSRPTYSKGGNSKLASSRTKGFARKQLANANAYSRRGASAGKGETASSDAGSAFDNNPGAGNTIEGPGIGKGAGRPSGTDTSANPNSSGGPTGNNPTVDCGPDRYQTADGSCEDIKTDDGTDANKTLTMLCQLAQGLLAAIAIIAAIALVLNKIKSPWTTPVEGAMRLAIGVMGGIVAMLGVVIMGMGDYAQGAIFAGIGGFIALACVGFEALGGTLTLPGAVVSAGAGLLLSAAASGLKGKGTKKEDAPVAAQQ